MECSYATVMGATDRMLVRLDWKGSDTFGAGGTDQPLGRVVVWVTILGEWGNECGGG